MKSTLALAIALFCMMLLPSTSQAVTVAAADANYGISDKQSNSFGFDFTGDANWIAGSQRSANGSADANNQRAGRVFLEFQLTPEMIAAANKPFASVELTLDVLLIGAGVSGTPYLDGLDLRFLGTSASNRTANTLWDTGGVGTEQPDIIATNAGAGLYTIELTNASVLSSIASASAGTFVAFGLSNSVGVLSPALTPVGNSNAETYGFQLNRSASTYLLSVVNIPEPATASLALLGLGGLMMRRRRIA